MTRYEIKKMGQGWWIFGDESAGPMGPYDTKAEAESDACGLRRFNRHENEPGYVTSEKRRKTEK